MKTPFHFGACFSAPLPRQMIDVIVGV